MDIENMNVGMETLTESEAARLLGVSKITLQRLRSREEISHFRIGSRVLYSPEQLKEYLAAVERKRSSGRNGGR